MPRLPPISASPRWRVLLPLLGLSVAIVLWAIVQVSTDAPPAVVLSGAALAVGWAVTLAMRLRDGGAPTPPNPRERRDLQRLRGELAAARADLLRSGQAHALTRTRLEATQRALDQFTSAVGHDLKAPLQTLIANAELLASGEAPLTERQARLVRRIRQGADTMTTMLDELLALARVGERLGSVRPFALEAAVAGARNALHREFRERHGSLEVVHPLPTALGSQQLLQEAIQNLLQNGLKYGAPDRPRLRVEPAPAPSGRVALAIEDNGLGVPPERRAEIFRPFVRLEGHPAEGSGAGLAIVNRIVELHGGTIRVTSGQTLPGARFELELPGAAEPIPFESVTDTWLTEESIAGPSR